jgi:hypothetical protein
MGRHSTRQQHLSQDMMAETLAQVNHCFSFSAKIKCTHPSNTNDVISSLVMANAVICPETGKYLKQQELITNLRHQKKMDEIHSE